MERSILRSSAPGILVALLCLLPFLGKAFTIDDPYFLTEAHQALRTPLTPAAAEMCWDNIGYPRSLREIGATGVAMGYALIPVAVLGDREWVGHLIVLLLLFIAVVATVSLAYRCGAGDTEAMLAGALFASFPVVLAMAGTVMPDILATAAGVIGLERILAWKQGGLIRDAVAAGVALGIAPLARTHTLLLLVVAIVMLAQGNAKWIRWLPVLIAIVCFVGVSWITSTDVETSAEIFPAGPNEGQIGWRFVPANLLEFGLNWVLVTPFAVGWLLMDRLAGVAMFGAALIGGAALKLAFPSVPIVLAVTGVMGVMAIASALVWAWRSGRIPIVGLAVCLLIAAPMSIYLRLPSKYLVPCAPAAAILLAARIFKVSRAPKLVTAILVCAGMAVGIALLRADAEFSGLARRAVAEATATQVQSGHRAWYSGQWAQTWYAQRAGASCLTANPPYPQPGDVVIAGELDGNVALVERVTGKKRLVQTIRATSPGVRIMNASERVGFYSNDIGYLPLRWSREAVNTYYVYLVE